MSSRHKEDVLLVNINVLPNYEEIKLLMYKQHGDLGLVKAHALFIKRSIQWLESYLYIIDVTNEIHIQLFFQYVLYFLNQLIIV